MQYESAWRKRSWLTQRFSSTTMRCITAIWPAGPPKESAATRHQTASASRSGGDATAAESGGAPVADEDAGVGPAAPDTTGFGSSCPVTGGPSSVAPAPADA